MAILHRKEEKLQVVLGRLPKEYTHEEFVEMFIKLYSKDWGKIKSAYIKQSQDREPGTIVNMPKPDLYLKQVLETYLANKPAEMVEEEPAKTSKTAVAKSKTDIKKKLDKVTEEKVGKKAKASTDETELAKTPKVSSKKKLVAEEQPEPVKEVKKKVPAKKKTETEDAPTMKLKKVKA